jgi:hypothetical protein
MPDSPTPNSRLPYIPWYYVTRAIGAFVLLFGVIGDASAERGTIILTGAGLLGIDKVARSESKGKDD